jgi:hypothetical protein
MLLRRRRQQAKDAIGPGSYAGPLGVRLVTLKTNPYAAAVVDGFSSATGNRLDQRGSGYTDGGYLLRCKVALAEAPLSDVSSGGGSATAAALTSLAAAAPVKITPQAAVPFDANVAAYDKALACSGGSTCPLTTFTNTCDMASNNLGALCAFTCNCPKVVPSCLWWDGSSSSFSGSGKCSGCVVAASRYTANAVACDCTPHELCDGRCCDGGRAARRRNSKPHSPTHAATTV